MNVFVGCSASNVVDKTYIEYIGTIGDLIIKNNDTLIAGGRVGIMNHLLYKLEQNNIKSQIITTTRFSDKLNFNDYATILKNGLEKTDEVLSRADVLIFMPGGIGTLGELIEAIELKRSGNYNFDIIILNIDEYYNDIISFLKSAKKKKFLNNDLSELIIVCNTLRSLKVEYNRIKLNNLGGLR